MLKDAYNVQDISNDGALSAVILSMAKGVILDGFRFNKRYLDDWPKQYNALKRMLITLRVEDFTPYKEAGRSKLLSLFPEYSQEIEHIFNRYKQNTCSKGYAICECP
jgi:hypothetical protein